MAQTGDRSAQSEVTADEIYDRLCATGRALPETARGRYLCRRYVRPRRSDGELLMYVEGESQAYRSALRDGIGSAGSLSELDKAEIEEKVAAFQASLLEAESRSTSISIESWTVDGDRYRIERVDLLRWLSVNEPAVDAESEEMSRLAQFADNCDAPPFQTLVYDGLQTVSLDVPAIQTSQSQSFEPPAPHMSVFPGEVAAMPGLRYFGHESASSPDALEDRRMRGIPVTVREGDPIGQAKTYWLRLGAEQSVGTVVEIQVVPEYSYSEATIVRRSLGAVSSRVTNSDFRQLASGVFKPMQCVREAYTLDETRSAVIRLREEYLALSAPELGLPVDEEQFVIEAEGGMLVTDYHEQEADAVPVRYVGEEETSDPQEIVDREAVHWVRRYVVWLNVGIGIVFLIVLLLRRRGR